MSVPPEYDDVVDLYIRLISLDSRAAADAIEQIRITCDARAALRATLAITLIKTEAQRHQPIPDADAYAYLLIDYPQALPLLNQAIDRLAQGSRPARRGPRTGARGWLTEG